MKKPVQDEITGEPIQDQITGEPIQDLMKNPTMETMETIISTFL
jgi:hypothetical protein